MGIGVISLVTSQKREPSGSPFTAGSAHNGTSIDAAGKVVLGNDVGDVTAPAALLNDREVLMDDALFNQFQIILNAIQSAGVRTLLRGDLVQVDTADFSTGQVIVGNATGLGTTAQIFAQTNDFGSSEIAATNSVDGNATIRAQVNQNLGGVPQLVVRLAVADRLGIVAKTGEIAFQVGQFALQSMAFNTTTLCTKVQSDTGAAYNGATLQVSGTHTYRKFDQSQNGALTLDRDLDSSKVLRNSGALTIDFPNFVGANFRVGFFVDVLVTNAAGVTINAGAGRLIHFGDLATSVNGTISSTSVGASIRIYVVDSTTFYTQWFIGAWSLT